MTKPIKYLLIGIVAVALVGVGVWIGRVTTSSHYEGFISAIRVVRGTNAKYEFVHPLMSIQTPNGNTLNEFKPLSDRIKNVAEKYDKVLSRHAIYFRDLTKGLWVGVNEDDKYHPASLLKISLAMAAYLQIQNDPDFLNTRFVYTPQLAKINTENKNNSKSSLVVGNNYSIKELLYAMIVDSDNGAKDILGNVVSKAAISEVYSNFNVPLPGEEGEYFISSRTYARFLRSLYDASVISQQNSNELLSLLSQAHFDGAIVAGVPKEVKVAHKFGEYVASNENTISAVELHDCGIVYVPDHPYLLCVMTQGKTEADLANFIADVSKEVYEEVISNYK